MTWELVGQILIIVVAVLAGRLGWTGISEWRESRSFDKLEYLRTLQAAYGALRAARRVMEDAGIIPKDTPSALFGTALSSGKAGDLVSVSLHSGSGGMTEAMKKAQQWTVLPESKGETITHAVVGDQVIDLRKPAHRAERK